jgi:hypothetical protein
MRTCSCRFAQDEVESSAQWTTHRSRATRRSLSRRLQNSSSGAARQCSLHRVASTAAWCGMLMRPARLSRGPGAQLTAKPWVRRHAHGGEARKFRFLIANAPLIRAHAKRCVTTGRRPSDGPSRPAPHVTTTGRAQRTCSTVSFTVRWRRLRAINLTNRRYVGPDAIGYARSK